MTSPSLLRVILVLGLVWLAQPARADSEVDEAVIRADAARVDALLRNDGAALAARLSEHLRYGHSDGRVQTKAQLLAALASNRIQYLAFNYTDRSVLPLGTARGLVGTAAIRVRSEAGPLEFSIRFLAVYVLEDGEWKLSAYQSTQLPPPAP